MRTLRSRHIPLIAGLVISSMALASCSASSGGSGSGGGSYVVGTTTDLSGSLAAIGTALREGYQAYFTQANDEGGIKGHKIKFTALDDMSNTTQGVANTKQLTQSKVSAEFVFLSNVIVAVAPILKTTKTPAIVQAATGDLLHPVQPQIFAGDIVIGDEAQPAISFAATKTQNSKPRVAIIAAQTAALSAYVANATKLAKAKGWDVVATEQVALTATTAAPQANAIAQAKPDIILSALTDPLAITADKALRQAGTTSPIINYDGGSAYSTLSQLADPDFYVIRPFPYADPSAGAGMAKYIKAAKAANLDPNKPFLINGYVQARILSAALEKCGYPCPADKTQAALEKLSKFDMAGLIYGSWTYTKTDHAGIHNVKIVHWDPAKNSPAAVSDLLPIKSD